MINYVEIIVHKYVYDEDTRMRKKRKWTSALQFFVAQKKKILFGKISKGLRLSAAEQ